MKILALEFSSEQRSVACADDAGGFRLLSSAAEQGGRSTRAIGLVEKVLSEGKIQREEVDCIAVGIGPGSYTGIRAAIAVAQGWQLAAGVKTIGISTVDCLALQAESFKMSGRVNVVIDAQRNEFYVARYEAKSSGFRLTDNLQITSAFEIEKRAEAGEIVIGPDAGRFFGGKILMPDAAVLADLASRSNTFTPAAGLEPIYLRPVSFVKAPPARIIS